jgi:hypothetical protein
MHIGFNLVTTGLAAGAHRLRAVARDLSGNSTTTETIFSLVEPARDVTPPAALALNNLSLSVPVNGVVLVTGLNGASEPGDVEGRVPGVEDEVVAPGPRPNPEPPGVGAVATLELPNQIRVEVPRVENGRDVGVAVGDE